jgi:hypothetical protein
VENSIIVSVNTIAERDRAIRKLYKSLLKNSSKKFTIQQDRVNRIKVFHNKGSLRVLIVTYLVIILPVLVDLSSLDGFRGTVDFRLDETIIKLEEITARLRTLNGKKYYTKTTTSKDLANALTNLF